MPIMIYRATYSFHTNGNDKDWDSQVGIDLVSNGSPLGVDMTSIMTLTLTIGITIVMKGPGIAR